MQKSKFWSEHFWVNFLKFLSAWGFLFLRYQETKLIWYLNECFQVNFTTTLFALIRENLKINVRESSEMDQADIELRTTIIKCWPHTKRDKIDLLVPTPKGIIFENFYKSVLRAKSFNILHGCLIISNIYITNNSYWNRTFDSWKIVWRNIDPWQLEKNQIWSNWGIEKTGTYI